MCSDFKKRQILHIMTRPFDEVSEMIVHAQQQDQRSVVQVISLAEELPDYNALLDAAFAADSIHVW